MLGFEELPDGRVALVLEDFGGISLGRLLEERGPLDVGTFLELACRISAALGHIHGQGVIHQGLTRRSLLVNPDTGVVKIAGFSLATALATEALTPEQPARPEGRLACMAPEQTGRMNRSVDHRADLYALGR